ncbi:MAG: sigma-54-dependent transcriptional regulator [Chitinivibrionales bacterium]
MAKEENKDLIIFSNDKKLVDETNENLCLRETKIDYASSYNEVLQRIEKGSPQVILFDLENTPENELNLVSYAKNKNPGIEIIVLTDYENIENAIRCIRMGAAFYLLKPIKCSDLQNIIHRTFDKLNRALEQTELEHEMLEGLMGNSRLMRRLLNIAIKVAPTSSTILVSGESGTGKEFFSKIIHRMSGRKGKFSPMNCGAIPDTLFESALFGHKKGAFTGADKDKPGMVEDADNGTLFLDEVGELSESSQVKLLRFLQDKKFTRIGDTKEREVDVRIIAATNREIEKSVTDKEFREDLYYRLNVFRLRLPPLRERKETIPNLIQLFVRRYSLGLNKDINEITKGAEAVLKEYDYPGNIRELENIIEHACVLSEEGKITETHLPDYVFSKRPLLSGPKENQEEQNRLLQPPSAQDMNEEEDVPSLAEVERDHIVRTLEILDWNYSLASKKLGISRSTLWRKLKDYNIN